MSKKKKPDFELLDRLASAIADQNGGDLENFMEDLKTIGGTPQFTELKKGAGVRCSMAGVKGAPAHGLANTGANTWLALQNWANAARRLINQEAA